MDQKAQLEKYISSETLITFVLTENVGFTGTINWFDNYNINITTELRGEEREITVHKSAIAYYYQYKEGDEPAEKSSQRWQSYI